MRLRRRRSADEGPRFGHVDSGHWIDVTAKVLKLLSDDHEGSRHQRFIVRIKAAEQTLLIAHNIDLADRVPVGIGDRLEIRGMYEWNDLGGLVHWTHHDPMGIEAGGYIKYRGKTYR